MTHWGVTLGEFGQHLAAGGRSKGTRELRIYHLSAFAESTTRGPAEVSRNDLESWLANPDWSANRAVQELLGHSSVATTQIYTAIPAEATRRGVAAAADGLRVA